MFPIRFSFPPLLLQNINLSSLATDYNHGWSIFLLAMYYKGCLIASFILEMMLTKTLLPKKFKPPALILKKDVWNNSHLFTSTFGQSCLLSCLRWIMTKSIHRHISHWYNQYHDDVDGGIQVYRHEEELASYIEGRGSFADENAMQFRGRSSCWYSYNLSYDKTNYTCRDLLIEKLIWQNYTKTEKTRNNF